MVVRPASVPDPDPGGEPERQRSVARYGLTGPAAWKSRDPGLFALAARARHATGCEDAAVTIFDGELQWLVAAGRGPAVSVYPRSLSLCNALLPRRGHDDEVVVVRDAAEDAEVATNPWVRGPFDRTGFFAVVAVVGREGEVLGTVCCWSRAPGTLDLHGRLALRNVRDAVVRELDARRDAEASSRPSPDPAAGSDTGSTAAGSTAAGSTDAGSTDAGEPHRAEITGAPLRTVFQPIVHLATGEIAGYEALTRGAADHDCADPSVLFADAQARGRIADLDVACLAAAVDIIERSDLPEELTWFLNVEAGALDGHRHLDLVPPGLRAVLEVTERGTARDALAVLQLRDSVPATVGVALDDFGVQPIAQALLPLIRPDVVKVAVPTLRAMGARERAGTLAALHAYVRSRNAVLVVEGIETEADEHYAVALGAGYAQGYLYGEPGPLPSAVPAPRHPVPVAARSTPPPTSGLFESLVQRSGPARRATSAQLDTVLEVVGAAAGGDLPDTALLRRDDATTSLTLGAEVVPQVVVDSGLPGAPAPGDVLLAVGTVSTTRTLAARRRPDGDHDYVVSDSADAFAHAARSFRDHARPR